MKPPPPPTGAKGEPGNMPVCWGGGELNMGVCCCSIDSKKSVNDLGGAGVAAAGDGDAAELVGAGFDEAGSLVGVAFGVAAMRSSSAERG
jgi:hypothetical protein